MGGRRLAGLMMWLPPDSALWRAMGEWTRTDDLLALVAEVQDVTNVILMHVNAKENTKVREPITVPRPGHEVKAPEVATGNQLEGWTGMHGGNVVRGKKRKKK